MVAMAQRQSLRHGPHTTKWPAQARAEKSTKLQRKDKIRARIAELQEVAKQIANERFAMSAEEILHRLTLIGRASIADYVQIDKTGQPTIAFDQASPAQMYALQECSVAQIGDDAGYTAAAGVPIRSVNHRSNARAQRACTLGRARVARAERARGNVLP